MYSVPCLFLTMLACHYVRFHGILVFSYCYCYIIHLMIKTDGRFPSLYCCHCQFFIGGVMGEENMDPSGYYLYTEAIRMVLIGHEQTKPMWMIAVADMFQEFGMQLSNLSYIASLILFFTELAHGAFILKRFFCRV